jgi:hypothetical protein
MKCALIILAIVLASCSNTRDVQVMKYGCLPNYRFYMSERMEDSASFSFQYDTTLIPKAVGTKITFVWNTGDTNILKVKQPGTYVVSIKGWVLPNKKLLISNSGKTYWKIGGHNYEAFCYKGTPDGTTRDSVLVDTVWYYSDTYNTHTSFESGQLDTVVIDHLVNPIIIGAKFLDNSGKIVTLNKWYYDKQIKAW